MATKYNETSNELFGKSFNNLPSLKKYHVMVVYAERHGCCMTARLRDY